jgi:predicted hydrocarbon binding protein
MQGVIFTAFSDMIIEKMGMEQWNELLDKTSPDSKGIYTSGDQYKDSELINMVITLSEKTGISVESLVEHFGKYLFTSLYKRSSIDVTNIDNLRELLLSIDSIIHVEVKRVHPQAYLPKFEYDEGENKELIMYYFSKRKLCHASVGLILGAAEYFKQEIEIAHPECMHDGAERCKLVIDFKE